LQTLVERTSISLQQQCSSSRADWAPQVRELYVLEFIQCVGAKQVAGHRQRPVGREERLVDLRCRSIELRGLQARECPQLADQGTTAGRHRPQHDVIEWCARLTGAQGDKPPEADADDGHPSYPRPSVQPSHRLVHGLGPGAQATGISGTSSTVTGAREIEAQGVVPGLGQPLGPYPTAAIRAHVLPPKRRAQQHGGIEGRADGFVVEGKHGIGRAVEIQRKGHQLSV
jgi:hypothetical protein